RSVTEHRQPTRGCPADGDEQFAVERRQREYLLIAEAGDFLDLPIPLRQQLRLGSGREVDRPAQFDKVVEDGRLFGHLADDFRTDRELDVAEVGDDRSFTLARLEVGFGRVLPLAGLDGLSGEGES